MANKTTINIGHVENINPNVREVRTKVVVNQPTDRERELKEAMSYAIDYCQRYGTNITTEEVWRDWCKDCEEASV